MSSIRIHREALAGIALFVHVAQTASFTAAARTLGLSVSGVSRSIQRLEERLGVRLISRTTRRISLTADGMLYYQRCKEILRELEEAEAAITQSELAPSGRLRIRLPRGFGRKVIVPALAEFLGRYPRISIDVTVDSGTVDLVEDGIDVAIQLGRPAGARLIARKLCPIHYALCAAPDYLRRYGAPRTIAELAAHRCVTYMQPEIGRYREWELRHNGRRTTAAVAGVLGVNDIYALLDAVVAGVGIGYLTDFMIAEALAAGKLAIVMPETAYEGIPAYIHYLPSRYRSPRIRVFVDFLVELLRQPPAWHIDKLIAQQQVLQPG